ncbi:hypothetical protein [Amycolatopsis sp. NPDC058986]|uniref:hypothetical protein n=1 Tax=unclassified Amycolatopsis TaxID=2618356 RepID=UPI00366D077F
MSWQEELRRLDEELAAGQISADDYRVRRDNVLSSAVSYDPQGTPQQAPGQADSTQIIAPVGGQPQQGAPQTGPPQQPQQPQQGSTADRTQIVNVPDSAERTQAVGQGTWQANAGEAERTQVVPGVPSPQGGFPAPNSGGFPAQQQQQPPYQQQQHPQQPPQAPWNAPSGDSVPPWGGSDFPPLSSTDHSWVGQGPEPFETKPSKGKGKIIGIAVAVVVVIALGVGAFFVFGNNGDNTAQPPASTSQTAPPAPPAPKDDLEIAKLPGTLKEKTDFPSFGDLAPRKVLTDDESDAYKAADASKARLAVSNLPSEVHAVVLTAQTSSPAAARTAADKLAQLQIKFKMQTYSGTVPPGVDVVQLAGQNGGASLIRAHYVYRNTVVRVQVDGADLASISSVFDEILAGQLKVLPANT